MAVSTFNENILRGFADEDLNEFVRMASQLTENPSANLDTTSLKKRTFTDTDIVNTAF